jgi:hypothetical protein
VFTPRRPTSSLFLEYVQANGNGAGRQDQCLVALGGSNHGVCARFAFADGLGHINLDDQGVAIGADVNILHEFFLLGGKSDFAFIFPVVRSSHGNLDKKIFLGATIAGGSLAFYPWLEGNFFALFRGGQAGLIATFGCVVAVTEVTDLFGGDFVTGPRGAIVVRPDADLRVNLKSRSLFRVSTRNGFSLIILRITH